MESSKENYNEDLGELISKAYNSFTDEIMLWSLVKYEYPTTSFIHFTSVASIAYKIAKKIKELSSSNTILAEEIQYLEQELGIPFEKYCFIIGLLHDYEKLGEHSKKFVESTIKTLELDATKRDYIERDAKSVEAGGSEFDRRHDLAVLTAHIADLIVSEDSVLMLRGKLVSGSLYRALRRLESLGLTLGTLYVGSHRFFTIMGSERVLKLFERNGWNPLAVYRDGIVFLGTKSSIKVSVEELANVFVSEIEEKLYKENIEGEIEKAVPRGFEEFVENVVKALAEELPTDIDSERSHLILLANKLAGVVKGEASLDKALEEVLRETERNKQSFQKSLLPPNRRPLENVLKNVSLETILRFVEKYVELAREERDKDKCIAVLSYFIVGWSKEQEKIAKLYRLVFREEVPRDILTIALSTIKNVVYLVENNRFDEIVNLYRNGFRLFLGEEAGARWRYEVYYFVVSSISGDVVEKHEIEFLATDKRCIWCRTPIFDEEPLPADEYGKAVGGGKGVQQAWTNDDIPLADKDEYTQSTEKIAKYVRAMCTLCKYEANVIGTALESRRGISIPFISIFFRPAIAPEVLSFAASMLRKIMGIELVSLYSESTKNVNGGVRGGQLPYNVVPNYLGASIIFSYKENIMDEGGDVLKRRRDLSGRRDEIYYGLLLIPALAKMTGGGQFKVCLSVVDMLSPPPPDKIVVLPIAVKFIEELNAVFSYLREKAKKGWRQQKEVARLYDECYYYYMKALEGVAIRLAFWYQRKVSTGKSKSATWIVKGIEEVDEIQLTISLLTPPSQGFDKAEVIVRDSRDMVFRRELYRPRYSDIYNIASRLTEFLSHVQSLMRGETRV